MKVHNRSQAVIGLAALLILPFLIAGATLSLSRHSQAKTEPPIDQSIPTNITPSHPVITSTLTVVPTRLRIPRLKIDAFIESVGLTANGSMDIPKDANNVAWFQLGPRPGEPGSAVIDGHYGSKNGTGAAFDGLHRLRVRDTVTVTASDGTISSFVVRKIQNYNPTADASEVFSSNDGLSHLNLITCEGEWNTATQSYSERLVVFTDKQ